MTDLPSTTLQVSVTLYFPMLLLVAHRACRGPLTAYWGSVGLGSVCFDAIHHISAAGEPVLLGGYYGDMCLEDEYWQFGVPDYSDTHHQYCERGGAGRQVGRVSTK